MAIALDPAASEFYQDGKYVFKKSDKSSKSSDDMVRFWAKWVQDYPIVSIEDGLAEDKWDGWQSPTWLSLPAQDRSRQAQPRARIASPSTTSCCGLKKNWEIRRGFWG